MTRAIEPANGILDRQGGNMSLIITAFLVTVGVGLGLGALVALFTMGQLGLIWAMDRIESTTRCK
jgi:hypothetical protein